MNFYQLKRSDKLPESKELKSPPAIHPYVFPALLLLFGIWFFYDGWLTSNTDMQKHLLFNRIGCIALIPWGLIDFLRTFQKLKNEKIEKSNLDDTEP